MASSLSPPLPPIFPSLSSQTHRRSHAPHRPFCSRKPRSLFLARSAENASAVEGSAVVDQPKLENREEERRVEVKADGEKSLSSNGAAVALSEVPAFTDSRWVAGTWDLVKFQKGGVTDWDSVIDAEARRRKWLEDNPEASSNTEPIVFDTSTIPWWAWVKRYHLPEAELLNGRAAMIGFFMAYFVDSLTGIGLVDQMGNFFCKILLLISVSGVMLIRKNDDIGKLKKLIDETTFYDKQWQATWQDDAQVDSNNK